MKKGGWAIPIGQSTDSMFRLNQIGGGPNGAITLIKNLKRIFQLCHCGMAYAESNPNKRTALPFRMPGITSGLKPATSKSFIQRSGVISG